MKQQQTSEGNAIAVEASEFSKLLNQEFKPKTDQAREAVESAVKTLAEQALAHSLTMTGISMARSIAFGI
jgi:type VI secretion system protein ImpC